jgi:hypothetical protein
MTELSSGCLLSSPVCNFRARGGLNLNYESTIGFVMIEREATDQVSST